VRPLARDLDLVFMQFYCDTAGARTPLPRPSIDTGMGLERIAAVMQGKLSNYDTDLLRPLVDRVATLSGKPYGGADSEDDVSMRVIADHARATTFLIGDGVTRPTSGGVMSCAGSCAGPCATAAGSDSTSRSSTSRSIGSPR